VIGRSTNRGVPTAEPGGRHIRVIELSHQYESDERAVLAIDRLDLDIAPGQFVTIVGPSGCGKSTLLEIIAGLRRPSEGRVEFDDRLVVGPSRSRGVVFQRSSSLFPWLTVQKNVELGLKIGRVPKKERAQRATQELQRVGIADFADRRVYGLSGGMQQRCQIARALATDPSVLLMDEPFGALDALTREKLQVELLEIWRTTGRTIVFVTHSIDEAVLLGSRVIVMSPRPGRVLIEKDLPFSSSRLSPAEFRSTSEFVETCQLLRTALSHDSDQGDTTN